MSGETRAIVEACHTDDGIDHGRHRVEECFWTQEMIVMSRTRGEEE